MIVVHVRVELKRQDGDFSGDGLKLLLAFFFQVDSCERSAEANEAKRTSVCGVGVVQACTVALEIVDEFRMQAPLFCIPFPFPSDARVQISLREHCDHERFNQPLKNGANAQRQFDAQILCGKTKFHKKNGSGRNTLALEDASRVGPSGDTRSGNVYKEPRERSSP